MIPPIGAQALRMPWALPPPRGKGGEALARGWSLRLEMLALQCVRLHLPLPPIAWTISTTAVLHPSPKAGEGPGMGANAAELRARPSFSTGLGRLPERSPLGRDGVTHPTPRDDQRPRGAHAFPIRDGAQRERQTPPIRVALWRRGPPSVPRGTRGGAPVDLCVSARRGRRCAHETHPLRRPARRADDRRV